MSGIVVALNSLPRYNKGNWPVNQAGFFCGTVPTDNAPCLQQNSLNIGDGHPWTFEQCCNGPIINVTSPITDPTDPSYNITCLSYCAVDFARSLIEDSNSRTDYWRCLLNDKDDTYSFDDTITGRVTCGWGNNTYHEQCEATNSAEIAAWATQSMVSPNGTSPRSTTKSCPPDITLSPTATATSVKKSGARSEKQEICMGSVALVMLLVTSGFLCL